MIQDDFSKLFRHMNKRFDALRQGMDQKADKKDVNAIINAIDGLYDRFDSLHLEYSATTSHQRRIQAQLNQHDTRITKLEQA